MVSIREKRRGLPLYNTREVSHVPTKWNYERKLKNNFILYHSVLAKHLLKIQLQNLKYLSLATVST
jgi:hypothetical protein